jgi:hypothetical protein
MKLWQNPTEFWIHSLNHLREGGTMKTISCLICALCIVFATGVGATDQEMDFLQKSPQSLISAISSMDFSQSRSLPGEIWSDIDMWREASSHGQHYGIEFEVDGDDVKDIDGVWIIVPNGKIMFLENTLSLNSICLEAWGMSYEEFENKFPQGEYFIFLWPQWWKTLKVNMTHHFPAIPVIIYPADGDTGVPLIPTIVWEPLTDIDGLCLTIESDDFGFDIDLPTDATSFTIPSGVLQPNTQYELWVEAEITDGGDSDLESCRCIHFTTAAE